MPDNTVVIGGGDGPNGNVCGLLQSAKAAMFSYDKIRLVICGEALVMCNTVFGVDIDNPSVMTYRQRVWSFACKDSPDWRLWLWPGGTIGIGRTKEEVHAASQAIQSACRRQRAGDLQRIQG